MEETWLSKFVRFYVKNGQVSMSLVTEIAKRGVTVQELNGQLRCIGTLTNELREYIKANKPAILAELQTKCAPKRPEPAAMAEKPLGPVELDPVAYLNLAADLIAACPPVHQAAMKRFHDDRLRFYRACPGVMESPDGPAVQAYGELDERCQEECGVWLAVWYMPDGKFKTEVCRREVTRPAPATSQIENKQTTKQAEPALF